MHVFISYCQEPPEHAVAVLDFARELRRRGFDVGLDQFEHHPTGGWMHWCRDQLARADVILVICNAEYKRRFECRGGSSSGVVFEGAMIEHLVCEGGMGFHRVIPVLLQSAKVLDIPLSLGPATRYQIPEQWDDLLRFLDPDQPPIGPNAPGDMWTHPRTGVQMAWIPTHEGDMAPMGQSDATGWWMARFPITREVFQRFVDKARVLDSVDTSLSRCNQPMTGINWNQAVAFCEWAELELPSEAEWERSARGQDGGLYCFGDDLDRLPQYAWYRENAPKDVPDVGQKLPNSWGLHDVHGLVWEWSRDRYSLATVDLGERRNRTLTATRCRLKGGSHVNTAARLSIEAWYAAKPEDRRPTFGMRPILRVPARRG